jgi:hypothetical protein
MARVKVHALCLRPLSECDCPDDDELDEAAEPQGGSDQEEAE